MNEDVTIDPAVIDQILKVRALLIDDWILNNQEKDQEFVYDVKEELYKRIDPYISDIKDRWGVTDSELDV